VVKFDVGVLLPLFDDFVNFVLLSGRASARVQETVAQYLLEGKITM
jgi:hypothetical protein